MKKFLQISMIIVCALSFLIGCDKKEETSISASGAISGNEYGSIEEFLKGDWVVGAVNIEGTGLVDISDVDALTDMYDSALISFDEDHEFFYYNHFYPHTGHYQIFDDGERILLVPEVTLKYPDEEWVEEPFDDDFNFLVTILDENTISVVFCYPETGEIKPDHESTLYKRDGEISQYIEIHKYDIYGNQSSEISATDEVESEDSLVLDDHSYDGILNTYTTLMENRVADLVNEYYQESAGIYDIETLAEICNEKVGILAEICNEGIGKMADLMYQNGDSYGVYESWADNLMDNYIDIADEIQDAYLDSPTY